MEYPLSGRAGSFGTALTRPLDGVSIRTSAGRPDLERGARVRIKPLNRLIPLLALGVAAVMLVALSSENRRLRGQATELYRRSVELHVGLPVPAIDTRGIDGAPLPVGAPGEGERQALFFFTTTCPYCLASLPAIQRIADAATADSTTVLYGVALDSMPAAREYVEEHELRFPVGVASDRRLAALYRVRRVPLIAVIGPDGRVVYTREGALNDAAAVDSVKAVLRPSSAAQAPPTDAPQISQASGGR